MSHWLAAAWGAEESNTCCSVLEAGRTNRMQLCGRLRSKPPAQVAGENEFKGWSLVSSVIGSSGSKPHTLRSIERGRERGKGREVRGGGGGGEEGGREGGKGGEEEGGRK